MVSSVVAFLNQPQCTAPLYSMVCCYEKLEEQRQKSGGGAGGGGNGGARRGGAQNAANNAISESEEQERFLINKDVANFTEWLVCIARECNLSADVKLVLKNCEDVF